MSLRDQIGVRDRAIDAESDPGRRILLTGATIVTMGPLGVLRGDLLVRGSTIEAVGAAIGDQVGADVIVVDASGTIILPGLIDSHLHAWEGQLRGIAPDADFGEYMAITHGGIATALPPRRPCDRRATVGRAGDQRRNDHLHRQQPQLPHARSFGRRHRGPARAPASAPSTRRAAHRQESTTASCPDDLIRLREEYFSGGQDLLTLRLFDVMPSVERWQFAAEHGFDLCAEMGFWVPDVEKLGESGLDATWPHLQPLLGLQRRHVGRDRRQRGRGQPRAAVGLAVRSGRILARAAGGPARHPDRHQLRQRAQLSARPLRARCARF